MAATQPHTRTRSAEATLTPTAAIAPTASSQQSPDYFLYVLFALGGGLVASVFGLYFWERDTRFALLNALRFAGYIVQNAVSLDRQSQFRREKEPPLWFPLVTVGVIVGSMGLLCTSHANDVPIVVLAVSFTLQAVGCALQYFAKKMHDSNPVFACACAEQSADHVVDRGPYAYVRHPIYAGYLITSVAILFGAWVPASTSAALTLSSHSLGVHEFYAVNYNCCLVCVVCFVICWVRQARVEERQFLANANDQLRKEYALYAAKTPMLIPNPFRLAISS